MKKRNFKKFNFYYIGLLLLIFILWWMTKSSAFLISSIPLVLIYLAIWILRWSSGPLKQVSLSEVNNRKPDTTGWLQARGVIQNFTPHSDVVENGQIVGHLMWFDVEMEDGYSKKWQTFVKDYYVPHAHLTSFGKFTIASLLYNPNKILEATFTNDDWHYEVK